MSNNLSKTMKISETENAVAEQKVESNTRYDASLISDYVSSISFAGMDYEKCSNFVVIAKYLPSDKIKDYDHVMNNLLEFYLENIESKSTQQFNIFFVTGLAKVENLPKVGAKLKKNFHQS